MGSAISEKERKAGKLIGRVRYSDEERESDMGRHMSLLSTSNSAYAQLKQMRSNLEALEMEARIRGMI